MNVEPIAHDGEVANHAVEQHEGPVQRRVAVGVALIDVLDCDDPGVAPDPSQPCRALLQDADHLQKPLRGHLAVHDVEPLAARFVVGPQQDPRLRLEQGADLLGAGEILRIVGVRLEHPVPRTHQSVGGPGGEGAILGVAEEEALRRIDHEARTVLVALDETRELLELCVRRALGLVSDGDHVGAGGDAGPASPGLAAQAGELAAAMLLEPQAGLPEAQTLVATDEVDSADGTRLASPALRQHAPPRLARRGLSTTKLPMKSRSRSVRMNVLTASVGLQTMGSS